MKNTTNAAPRNGLQADGNEYENDRMVSYAAYDKRGRMVGQYRSRTLAEALKPGSRIERLVWALPFNGRKD